LAIQALNDVDGEDEMRKVIIFGLKDYAELAHYYLAHDSSDDVVAFCVHRDYMPADQMFLGLPVIPFEEVASLYPPGDYFFFVPMSPKAMNRDREKIYLAVKDMGYQCISYVSSQATTFGNEIGENCFILENNTIQPFTKIGNNVALWSGNHIGHHGIIRDHVTFTSHVVMSGHCDIGAYSFFGVNSTLRNALKIAEGSFIAMSAAVVKDTEAWAVYKGNPAIKMDIPSTKMRF
jgi:sugar O-acyltransferase (sialic acid O-acetyltransferase NeuD family)